CIYVSSRAALDEPAFGQPFQSSRDSETALVLPDLPPSTFYRLLSDSNTEEMSSGLRTTSDSESRLRQLDQNNCDASRKDQTHESALAIRLNTTGVLPH